MVTIQRNDSNADAVIILLRQGIKPGSEIEHRDSSAVPVEHPFDVGGRLRSIEHPGDTDNLSDQTGFDAESMVAQGERMEFFV